MEIQKLEQFLQSKIFPDLEKGDLKWDKPHTQAVIHYVKEIIKHSAELNLDLTVLLIAAYAHDWGYSKFYKPGESLSYGEYSEAKKQHMEIGSEMVTELLEDEVFNFLSDEQKQRIIHLVSIHDKAEDLKENDELVLMEADVLGALDTDFVQPTFDKESNAKVIESIRKRKFSRFINNYSKQQFDILLKKRQDYYKNHPEL